MHQIVALVHAPNDMPELPFPLDVEKGKLAATRRLPSPGKAKVPRQPGPKASTEPTTRKSESNIEGTVQRIKPSRHALPVANNNATKEDGQNHLPMSNRLSPPALGLPNLSDTVSSQCSSGAKVGSALRQKVSSNSKGVKTDDDGYYVAPVAWSKRLKVAVQDFFRKDTVDESQFERIEDRHWTEY